MSSTYTGEPRAAILQEAIDAIAREFDYPDAVEFDIESDRQGTLIEIERESETRSYVLRFDGGVETGEPVLRSVSQ